MRQFSTVVVVAVFLGRGMAADDSESKWRVQDIRAQNVRIQNINDRRSAGSIFFVSEQVGWLCAGVNGILKTTDGGSTWTELATNLAATGTQISGIWFSDPDRGWAAGEIRQQPTLWESVDGGISWVAKYQQPRAFEGLGSNGAMLDVRFVDDEHGWAVGFNGQNALIVATADGGEHWSLQYLGGEISGQFNLVRFWDAMNGWVLGPNAALRTADGGENWKLQFFDSGSRLNDMDLVGPSEVWLAGNWGHLVHTEDGFRWTDVRLGDISNDVFLAHVKFHGKSTGWAWGIHGEILMTRDGGITWAPEPTPLSGKPDSEDVTGFGSQAGSKLFITLSPGRILSRPTD